MGLVGRLEDLGISDIFQILGIGRKTGTLIINAQDNTVAIEFKDGAIVRAETTLSADSLSESLVQAGLLKPSTLQLASAVKKKLPDKSIVEILLELDAVRKEQVERVAKKRIEKVIYEIMRWSEGDFQFQLDETRMNGEAEGSEHGWRLQKGLSPEYLLMEGARVYDESTQEGYEDASKVLPGDESMGEESGWEEDWAGETRRKDISSLKALTQELRFPNSASEITLLILRFASDIFQRGVLFMAGPEEMAGLGQFGLDIERADEKIRQIHLGFQESPFLSDVVNLARMYKGPVAKDKLTERFISEMGGGWPSEAVFFPLVAEGNVVALLYCDNLGGEAGEMPESEGLEIFINHAGLALEKALLQKRIHEMEKDK